MTDDAKRIVEDLYAHLEMLTEFAAALLEAITETHPEIASAYEKHRVALDEARHGEAGDRFADLTRKLKHVN